MSAYPHSLEAEKAVIGSVVIRPSAIRDVELAADDFYLPLHRSVWTAMLEMDMEGQVIDPVAIADSLKAKGQVGDVLTPLMDMASWVPSAENITTHARIVQEKARLRTLAQALGEAQSLALSESVPSGGIVDQVSGALLKLSLGMTSGPQHVAEVLGPVTDSIAERAKAAAEGGEVTMGVTFGVGPLDDLTGGVRDSNLCVIAADPGGGKTALAMQAMLTHVFAGNMGLAFNLEMSAGELAERALVHLARVNSHSVRMGQVDYAEYRKLLGKAGDLSKVGLWIEDRTFTTGGIVAKARAWRSKHAAGKKAAVLVDYTQLVTMERTRGDSEASAIGAFTRAMKRLAKELQCALFLVSQFNRDPSKNNRRPQMSDLKGSSSIEQDADQIILIHNPDNTEDGPVELMLAKNRHGACRMVQAKWEGRWYRFSDWEGAL